jgi:hypothetical protein
MREYLKGKIDELATNSKNKNIREMYRGINTFKRLIKMCLNETCSKFHIRNPFCDSFPIQNGLQQADDLSPLFFQLCFRICH